MSTYQDLLREADDQLEQDEDEDAKPGWGELWKPEEGEHRLGRYIGEDSYWMFGETRIVYLFLDHPDVSTTFYLEWKTRLGKAMDEARPIRGDIVLIKRGQNKDVEQPNPMHRYVLRTTPCADPLPGQPADRPARRLGISFSWSPGPRGAPREVRPFLRQGALRGPLHRHATRRPAPTTRCRRR